MIQSGRGDTQNGTQGLQRGQGTPESLNAVSNTGSWGGRAPSGTSLRLHDEPDRAKLLFRTISLVCALAANKLYHNCIFAICWSLNSGSVIIHVPLCSSPLPPLLPDLQN